MIKRRAPGEETRRAAPEPAISHARAAKTEAESTTLTAQRGVRPVAGADASVAGTGQPLPAATRAFFEPRFGHDFSRVRIHADGAAGRSAQALGAQAYTIGRDVVFGFGRYAPRSAAGQRLLAHELAHVVQQAASGERVQRKALYEDPAWATSVGAAKTDADKLVLLNDAADSEKAMYPDLILPIQMLPAEEKSRVAHQVYYDPGQGDPGLLVKLRKGVSHWFGSDTFEAYPASKTVPGETAAPACVVLGPAALSSHNRAQTGAVLYHEFVHLRQHEGRQHRALLDAAAKKSSATYRDAKETLAHAETFKAFFGRLYYDDAKAYDDVAAGRTPHDALASLSVIEALNWASLYSLPDVKAKAIELIMSAAPTEPKKIQLRKLVQQLTGGNIVGAPNDFKKDLLAAL